MAEDKPKAIAALSVVPRFSTIYPAEYAGAVQGRLKRALGDQFGLTQYGVNLTELAPGAASSVRHWHKVEDEFIYALEGEVVLVDDDGEHLLTPGMCAGFKANVPNGHQLVNRSQAPARYLEIGTRSPNETATYPDADMVGIKTGGVFTVTRKDGSAF